MSMQLSMHHYIFFKVLYEVYKSFTPLLHISLWGDHGDHFKKKKKLCGILFVIWLAAAAQVIDSQESSVVHEIPN